VTADAELSAALRSPRASGHDRRRSRSGGSAGPTPERPGGDRRHTTGHREIPRGPGPSPDHVRHPLGAGLLRALSGGGDDLAASLDTVLALARASCPSCVAVSLILDHGGRSTTVTATTDLGCTHAPSVAIRSLRAGPDPLGPGPAVLVVFATDALALARLAADIASLGTHRCRVALQAPARIPPPSSADVVGTRQLADRTMVDRALGALLEQGWVPDEGREELQRRADTAGTPLVRAAAVVLAALPGAPGPPPPGCRSPPAGRRRRPGGSRP